MSDKIRVIVNFTNGPPQDLDIQKNWTVKQMKDKIRSQLITEVSGTDNHILKLSLG